MKIAPLHPQEDLRLQALESLRILDTDAEVEFDDITKLAAHICMAPISLVSLVDSTRQWFKSAVGLGAKETPRSVAFCSHALLQENVFEVPDSAKDERFADNPLVTGDPHVVFYAGAPVHGPAGLPIGTLCVIDNIPRNLSYEQKSALQTLANQVTRLLDRRLKNSKLVEAAQEIFLYKTALEHMPVGVVLQDPSGAIQSFNPAALKILGMSEDELRGKSSLDPLWQCIKEDGSPFPGDQHPAMVTLRTGLPQKDVIMGVITAKLDKTWIRIQSQPIFNENSSNVSYAVTTFADITQLKRNEALFVETAKLTSLGEMAAGIAHEINTPLTVITTLSEILLRYIDDGIYDSMIFRTKIDKIDRTALRIATIVRGLRTFSRDASANPLQEVSLVEIVNDSLALCSERFKSHSIKIKFHATEDVKASGVPTLVTQVLVNLLGNAFDAIHGYKEKWIEIIVAYRNQNALITVIDCGVGIPENILSKIMNPFFTTKEPNKGTGLGLSISKGIMENMDGKLYYELKNGHTAFTLEMQVCPPKQSTEQLKS